VKIDVLHLLPSLSLYGGTPRKIRDLIQASPRRHAVYCWTRWEDPSLRPGFDEAFREAGVTVLEGAGGRNLVRHLYHLSTLVDRHSIKVLHGYFETGLLLATAVRLLRPNTKAIVSFVGFPAAQKFPRGLLLRACAPSLSHAIYVSLFTRGQVQAAYPHLRSVPSSVIYNGVKARGVVAGRSPAEELRLISVSGLTGFKNLAVILEALRILRFQRSINARLTIVGDGPLRKELEARATALELSEYVSFPGYRDDVGLDLAASDIYLHPSIREGFGLAVVEAMLQRLPVIVAQAGALPELVEDGISGLVVAPTSAEAWAESICRLAKDSRFAKAVAENALSQARNRFSVERFASEHEQIYRSLIAD
jgi:glycosyltransferase involved in cell wall biosynthesis